MGRQKLVTVVCLVMASIASAQAKETKPPATSLVFTGLQREPVAVVTAPLKFTGVHRGSVASTPTPVPKQNNK